MSPFCRQTPISGPATGLSWLLRDGTWRWAYATFGGLAHVRGVHARMEKGLSGRGCLRHVRLAVLRLLYFCTPPTGEGGTVPDRPRCGPSSTCICTVMARRRLTHLSRKRWLFHSITQPSEHLHISHIQTSRSADIPLDQFLTSLHLGEQCRIANDPRSILHLSTRLV